MEKNFRFPKSCRAKGYGECGGVLSKEHVVSNAILRNIGSCNWTYNGKVYVLGSGSFVTRSLCEKHNQELSIFDAEAVRFIETWNRITLGRVGKIDKDIIHSFDGYLIEKWFAKTLLNYTMFFHQAFGAYHERLNFSVNHINEVLYSKSPHQKQFKPPFGLYKIIDQKKTVFSPSIQFGTINQPMMRISSKTGKLSQADHTSCLSIDIGGIKLLGYFNVERFVDYDCDGKMPPKSKGIMDFLSTEEAQYRSFDISFTKSRISKPFAQIRLDF